MKLNFLLYDGKVYLDKFFFNVSMIYRSESKLLYSEDEVERYFGGTRFRLHLIGYNFKLITFYSATHRYSIGNSTGTIFQF